MSAHLLSSRPERILPPRRAWPLHDAATSRAMEVDAAAALPAHTLMARAGLAVARLALAVAPRARRVRLLAGPGNNGGDALVAARWLQARGLEVAVTLLSDRSRLPADAAWALAEATGVRVESEWPQGCDADLIVDGLLGLGLSRAPEGALAEAIRRVNAAQNERTVLAIDLPSGLDGDQGRVFDGLAVRATHTLSLLSLKPGLFTHVGRDHAGALWFDDLGVTPAPTSMTLIAAGRDETAPHAAHKGSHGDVIVIGGAAGMGGAAVLAAHAALAAGAGRVFLGALGGDAALPACRAEVMRRTVTELATPERLAGATVVAGCGGGDDIATILPLLLHHARQLVLDADALNAIGRDESLRSALSRRSGRGRPTVLTPHPAEAARLLDCPTSAVQADRLGAARQLASALTAVVVLKGSGTVIAQPDGTLAINATGNARLASGGTGDVLAGWVGGRWARRGDAAAEAAADAVHRHGLAAEVTAGSGPLLAADLIGAMQALH